jgi:hypothetical protein
MEHSFEDQIKSDKVKKKVKEMKGFYKHFTVYLAVNIFLLIIKSLNLEPGESFFTWNTFATAICWGIGVFFHWYSVFGAEIILGKNWEERKIKEMMEKDKNKKWN